MSETNIPPSTVAALPAEKPRERFFVRVLRGVLMLLIVVTSLYVARGYWWMWSDWRQSSQSRAFDSYAAADMNSMATAVVPLSGQWSFAELDWDIRSNTLQRQEVGDRFEKMAALPAEADDSQLPDVSAELIALATSLKVKPVERAGNQIYRLNQASLKAQLVARVVGGRPRVVALTVAYLQSADTWQLFELSPRQPSRNTHTANTHLLPLPGGAERLGGRFADDGSILLELISLHSSAAELLDTWKGAGWTVRPADIGNPEHFRYLCARGNEVIYAWSADERGSMENLMLVRAPASSDTNP